MEILSNVSFKYRGTLYACDAPNCSHVFVIEEHFKTNPIYWSSEQYELHPIEPSTDEAFMISSGNLFQLRTTRTLNAYWRRRVLHSCLWTWKSWESRERKWEDKGIEYSGCGQDTYKRFGAKMCDNPILAALTSNQEGSVRLLVHRVRPTSTRYPTNILYTVFVTPVGHWLLC